MWSDRDEAKNYEPSPSWRYKCRQKQVSLSWVPCRSGQQLPAYAIPADDDDDRIYVARAWLNDELIPGKAMRYHDAAYITVDGRETSVEEFEVLCDTHVKWLSDGYQWTSCSGFIIPSGAVVGGKTRDNTPLYIARGKVNGDAVAGNVVKKDRCAYFPYDGDQVKSKDFQILVYE